MLTLMAINIQAARALLYRTCALIDMTEAIRGYLESDARQGRPRGRRRSRRSSSTTRQLIRFFTPLCKYYATEISNHVTRQGIQVHGGIGYMAESPAGHYHSDSIITTIYEGTSEIQASFALKEMAKGALFATLEAIAQRAGAAAATAARTWSTWSATASRLDHATSMPALMGDPQYALLNAKRVCEMVIDVVVAPSCSARRTRRRAGSSWRRASSTATCRRCR